MCSLQSRFAHWKLIFSKPEEQAHKRTKIKAPLSLWGKRNLGSYFRANNLRLWFFWNCWLSTRNHPDVPDRALSSSALSSSLSCSFSWSACGQEPVSKKTKNAARLIWKRTERERENGKTVRLPDHSWERLGSSFGNCIRWRRKSVPPQACSLTSKSYNSIPFSYIQAQECLIYFPFNVFVFEPLV